MLTERDPGRRLEEFDCGHDQGGDPEIGADNPLDNIVLAESYQFFGLLPQRLDIGLGGEVAFQQPDTLSVLGCEV